MARILLIDADPGHASSRTLELQRRGHLVTKGSPRGVPGELVKLLTQSEIALVNVTADQQVDWDLLREVCEAASTVNPPPSVVAVSSVYRGPSARLRAQRLGAALVYA
jgi:hypothetical protein